MNRTEQLETALKTATQQLRWHIDQVSGAWSIDGESFCKEYGLDYEAARSCEIEEDFESLISRQDEEIVKIGKYFKLTPMQVDEVREKVSSEWVSAFEEVWFWQSVVDQIEKGLDDEVKKEVAQK